MWAKYVFNNVIFVVIVPWKNTQKIISGLFLLNWITRLATSQKIKNSCTENASNTFFPSSSSSQFQPWCYIKLSFFKENNIIIFKEKLQSISTLGILCFFFEKQKYIVRYLLVRFFLENVLIFYIFIRIKMLPAYRCLS